MIEFVEAKTAVPGHCAYSLILLGHTLEKNLIAGDCPSFLATTSHPAVLQPCETGPPLPLPNGLLSAWHW